MEIPQEAKDLMDQGLTLALATVDAEGMPNVAPMLQYWWLSEGVLVIGDLFMKATKANVQATERCRFRSGTSRGRR